jgi:hypothetical protein
MKSDDWLVRSLPSVDGSTWAKYRSVARGRSQSLESVIAEAVTFYKDNYL